MTTLEQRVGLECLSLLEDHHPRSLTFTHLPTDGQPDGVVHCRVCDVSMPQVEVTAHVQGYCRWAVSAHRRRRHERDAVQERLGPDIPLPSNVDAAIIDETHEMGLARWRRTRELRALGPFVALEDGGRVFCEACRQVLVFPDTPTLLEHLKCAAHRVTGVEWLRDTLDLPQNAPPAKRGTKTIEKKLETNLRKRVARAVSRNFTAAELFGAPLWHVRQHIEAQWKEGMSWANYGSWHVDHITPVCAYDAADEVHCLAMCHWSNLQPLWGHENLAKGGRDVPK